MKTSNKKNLIKVSQFYKLLLLIGLPTKYFIFIQIMIRSLTETKQKWIPTEINLKNFWKVKKLFETN